jgi:hypothetical protein
MHQQLASGGVEPTECQRVDSRNGFEKRKTLNRPASDVPGIVLERWDL